MGEKRSGLVWKKGERKSSTANGYLTKSRTKKMIVLYQQALRHWVTAFEKPALSVADEFINNDLNCIGQLIPGSVHWQASIGHLVVSK